MTTQNKFNIFKHQPKNLTKMQETFLAERCLAQMDIDSDAYPKVGKQETADEEINICYITS